MPLQRSRFDRAILAKHDQEVAQCEHEADRRATVAQIQADQRRVADRSSQQEGYKYRLPSLRERRDMIERIQGSALLSGQEKRMATEDVRNGHWVYFVANRRMENGREVTDWHIRHVWPNGRMHTSSALRPERAAIADRAAEQQRRERASQPQTRLLPHPRAGENLTSAQLREQREARGGQTLKTRQELAEEHRLYPVDREHVEVPAKTVIADQVERARIQRMRRGSLY